MTTSVDIYGKQFTVGKEPAEFWGWVADGRWEPGTFRIFDRYLTPETSFIDIGAWIGPTVLYASRLVNHVWALEPDPVAYQILSDNLKANLDIQNVETFADAILNYEGVCRLGASEGLGGSITRLTSHANEIEVPCMTLSQFIERHHVPDPLFIKMDVEGAEALILRDPTLFETRKPDLYVSTHQTWWHEGGWNQDEAMQTIRRIGSIYRHQISWRGDFYDLDLNSNFSEALFTDRD